MTPPLISRTGRVQSWIDDPSGRLPVSCTVFVVDNELESENGIEASWRFASHALRNGAGVAIHLSKLDPKGHERPSGVVASGPVSFGRIYSSLNETLRRGGKYKNGAIVLHLDADHPDIDEFITAPREALPWVKRCVNISLPMWPKTSPSSASPGRSSWPWAATCTRADLRLGSPSLSESVQRSMMRLPAACARKPWNTPGS